MTCLLTCSPETSPPVSTATLRNPFFGPKERVVCTGIAVRASSPPQTNYLSDCDFVDDGVSFRFNVNGSTEIVLDGSRVRYSG